jgi:hypothetical protein
MAIVFSESTNKTGMYELFQDLTKTNSTSYPIAKFTRDCNNAYAQFMMLALRASGKWQVDDTNQSDYPEIKINLIANQYDYPFTTDASTTPNQILDIERVECAVDSTGSTFALLEAYDEMDEDSIVQARTVTGKPFRYSKRANGIFLDPTPDFSLTNGLRVFFSRTPVYFLTSDTTKTAGIPDMFQEYLVYRPAYLFCVTNMPSLAPGYLAFLQKMEKDIARFYSSRNKDEHQVMTMEPISYT